MERKLPHFQKKIDYCRANKVTKNRQIENYPNTERRKVLPNVNFKSKSPKLERATNQKSSGKNVKKSVEHKAKEVWADRRKFLSRGFIGSTLALAGTAGITRGSTELIIENAEQVKKLPDYARKVPPAVVQVPKYVEEAIETVPLIPEKISEFVDYSQEEFASIEYGSVNCYSEDEGIHQDPYINIPYSDSDPCALWGETRVDESYPLQDEIIFDSNVKNNNSLQSGLSRISLGSAMLGVGVVLARTNKTNSKISRRTLFEKMKTGASLGVAWSVIDSDLYDTIDPLSKE